MPNPQRVLVSGATGYVGGRLVPSLLASGYDVSVLARNPEKLRGLPWSPSVSVHQGDAIDPSTLAPAFAGVDVAYYLLHALGTGKDFHATEQALARNFATAAKLAGVRQIIYLGGIANSDSLSTHLRSRSDTGSALRSAGVPVIELRAGIILGPGSASFEMLRYLTEHLPVMITPRWVQNRTQPIAVSDVLWFLARSAEVGPTDAIFDLGGPDVLTYQEMMQRYASVADLRPRTILPVPLLTPKLSSLWVGLVTPVPSNLAKPLVESLVAEVVADPVKRPDATLGAPPGGLISFDSSIRRALEASAPETRWSDAGNRSPWALTPSDPSWAGGIVYEDLRSGESNLPLEKLWSRIESIGGSTGWYGSTWAWRLRGLLDSLVGGVGLRRGRRDPSHLRVGDALDFWRVVSVEPPTSLVLFAEMRLPGTARLSFTLKETEGGSRLIQRATFRPRGPLGHAYWWIVKPFHAVVFPVMLRNILDPARDNEASSQV